MSIIPLESNPEVMNKFLRAIGVSDKWNIVDVVGLDEQSLAWVPQPVLALMLLAPYDEEKNKSRSTQASHEIETTGQAPHPDLFFMTQCVENMCGTVALIHSIANNTDRVDIDGPFKQVLENTKGLAPNEKGEIILKPQDSEGFNLFKLHQELANEGQTERCSKANYHYMALVEKGGFLYELDGTKDVPINHGPTTKDTFVQDAAKVCQNFMDQEPGKMEFTVLALAAADM